jgi:hypothetical protein
MKIILTCGHPYSGHQAIAELLQYCGVANALPSRNNQYSPTSLQSKIFEVYEWDVEDSTYPLPELGKVWQELGSDLFMGNLSQLLWGWSDHQTVWLLDFWKDFDPQIRFVLVYSAPEFVICNMLQQQVDAPADMDSILAAWNRYNTELLRFYNRNRDRCLLINAQTALQHPSVLLEKMADAFTLRLQLPAEEARQNTSRVAAGLACSLISNTSPTDQNALYQELESTADIISSGVRPSTQERLQAWSEYNRLIRELNNNASLTEQQQQELETLKAELEQQTHNNLNKQQELEQENELLLLQLHQVQEELEQHVLNNQELGEKEKQLTIDIQSKQQEVDNLRTKTSQLDANIQAKQHEIDNLKANTSQLEASISAKQELEQENELLLLQLHQVQEELEQHFLDKQELGEKEKQLANSVKSKQQEIDNLKANTSQLDNNIKAKQQEIDSLKANTSQLDNNIKAKQQEIDSLKANISQLDNNIKAKQQEIDNLKVNTSQLDASISATQELEQENELLLLQLHQVQEELEHYFLEYQKVSTIPPKPDYNLTGISLDPRKESFTGNNWYYAEHDGRWAGPATSSTINIPPMAQDKDYEIVLEIIGAMSPEIINEMKASLNSKPLDIHHPAPIPAWKRGFRKEKRRYPYKIKMRFKAEGTDCSQIWILRLDFPNVLSPFETGEDSDDKRKLAIRLHNASITQI